MPSNSSNSSDFKHMDEEILNKLEGALNVNSRGRKGRIPKDPKHQWIEKNLSNSQHIQGKYREVKPNCSHQQPDFPPCECIMCNLGHKSMSKKEYKFKSRNLGQRKVKLRDLDHQAEVKPQKLDQRVNESDFDDKFRYRRKDTDDGVCPLNGWWKPVFEIGLLANAMLCSDKYRINPEYQQKIGQKN